MNTIALAKRAADVTKIRHAIDLLVIPGGWPRRQHVVERGRIDSD
jgi:hypothetical protein